jgi:hypothetical protein
MTRRSSFRWLVVLLLPCFGLYWMPEPLLPAARASDLVAGDLNDDTDVDVGDFALFRECLNGPDVNHDGSATCQAADIDYDGDVDMADFGVLQGCFSGPGVPGDPACACVRPEADLPIGAAPNPVYSGYAAYISVASSQGGISYQLRNNADNSSIGSPVAGTGGTIYLPSDPLTSAKTFNILAINAAAGCSLQLTSTVTVTVNPYTPKNKIGVHVNGPHRNGYGPFITETAAVDKPVAVVKCYQEWGAAYEPAQSSPKTLLVGRASQAGGYSLEGMNEHLGQDPAAFAETVFNNALLPLWNSSDNTRKIQVWEVFNEWDAHYDWQSKFLIRLMDLAETANPPRRVALFGSATGTPPVSAWPYVADACRRAKAHGNHVLALHEYPLDAPDPPPDGHPPGLLMDAYNAHPEELILRYRKLYRYLIPQNADCPLVITEVAQGAGGNFSEIGTDWFVQDFGWYDARMREDPYVIGCCIFTLGGVGWGGANFQDALPTLTQYIVTH